MTQKQFSQLTNDQLSALAWLEHRDTGTLWFDVGCGKTVVLLTHLKRLLDRFDVRRVLVVGPRLVAERVWAAEATEWVHLHGLRVSRIVGPPAKRDAALAAEADIYTVSRDNVEWLESKFIRTEWPSGTPGKGKKKRVQFRAWPFDCLVLDESQSFKNPSAGRTKSIRRLRTLCSRVYLATGSFIPNGHIDAWHQAYLMDGGKRLGATKTEFLDAYYTKEVNDGIPTFTIKKGAGEEIDKRISDIVYVIRDAQPPAPNNFIKVQLSKDERATYSRMVRASVLSIGDAEVTAVNAGALWGKLLQMANGAVYDETHQWHEIHKRKLEALWELLESLPKPVLIGYGFVHDVERIFKHFPKALGKLGVLRTGESLDAWRRREIDIGVMHPASASHGLNDLYLSGAENIVWFGLTPNREFFDQLNGRLAGGHRRTGRNVCIHHLIAEGTVDEDAMALLDFKGDQQVAAQIRVVQRMKEGAACTTSSTRSPEESSKIPATNSPSEKTPLSIES